MYTNKKLTNGLRLITTPLKETKAVTVLVLLPVGSRYETKQTNGISHFIEHLMFKGTTRRPTSLDLTKELDSVGATYNAFTSKDQTGYYIKIAAEKIDLAFDVLSDMLLHAKFESADIEKERGVIVEEINMYRDNPLMHIDDVFEETVFANHPLGWTVAGPREVIKTVPRSAIMSYRDRFYHPDKMVVSVAGAVSQSTALRLTKKYFSARSPRVSRTGLNSLTVRQSQPRVSLSFKDTEQVQLCLGFPAYGLSDRRLYPLTMLSVILGGNMSSRLFIKVREQHSLAYFVRASADSYQDTGSFVVQAGLEKRRIKEAISLIIEELRQARREGVTKQELQAAKEFLRGRFVLDLEDSEHVANWYAKQQLLLGKVMTPDQQLKKIFAITQDDVKKTAADIIRRSRCNLALIGPFKATEKQSFLKLMSGLD